MRRNQRLILIFDNHCFFIDGKYYFFIFIAFLYSHMFHFHFAFSSSFSLLRAIADLHEAFVELLGREWRDVLRIRLFFQGRTAFF